MMMNYSLAEVVIRPGDVVLGHHHVESEELFYILEGESTITADGETCQLCEKDAVVVPRGAIHKVQNGGNKDLRMLVYCLPSYSDDDQIFP